MCQQAQLVRGLDGEAVKQLLQGAVLQGLDPSEILRAAAIDPSVYGRPHTTIDGRDLVRLVRRIQLLLDDIYLGFLAPGCRLALEAERLLSILNCTTFSEALRVSVRFTHAMSPAVGPCIVDDNGAGLQHICEYQTIPGVDRDLFVWIRFAWIFHFFSWLIGRPLAPRGLSVRGPRPAQENEFDRFSLFGCPVRFNAPVDALLYDWGDLSAPIVRHSIEEYDDYYAAGPDWLEGPGKKPSWRERTRQALIDLQRAGEWTPNVETVAARLLVGTRRLRRNLHLEGESFQEIRTRLRGEAAGAYLLVSDLPVAKIGFMVGFDDPACFSRQFSAWAGMTPSAYRSRYITDRAKLILATAVLNERRAP